MAQRTKKRQEQTFQTVLPVTKYLGMHATTNALLVGPGESGYLQNVDIFAGKDSDYIKSRRGSRYLRKASGPAKHGSSAIQNRITWDVGSEEYLITQDGTSMYSQALITTGNPTLIALASGSPFTLGSSSQTDLFISGDKLYVFHPSANYVIRWTGTAFVAYPMGLAFPWISGVTSATAGVISGSYTIGIEKVYRVSGVDLMASTPNRKTTASPSILAVSGTIAFKKIKITLRATELDNDTLWTDLRVWRSKNKNADTTDVLNPIDAQGNDDELYEEALISRAELALTSLTSVATGSTLPPGNAGTQAGTIATVPTIELNNLDSVFFNLIGIDRIELLPIPACTTGCFCGNRIFFSGVQDAALDDASKSNIWYSNYAGTKYAFQYNPLNFVDTGRDGQNMIKLIAFEKDVIGLKESKTGRLPSGNVDIPYQTLDDRIGISHKNLAAFVPTLGLLALTSDFGDFRIFGYDLRWNSTLNGIDISMTARYYTSLMTGSTTFFAYHNGKAYVFDGTSGINLVLHVKEGRGWTRSVYQNNQEPLIFTFAQGTRIAFVSLSNYLVEMEISGLNTDVTTSNDTSAAFNVIEITRAFRSNEGRDVLEHEFLSIDGAFASGNVTVYPYANTLTWPDKAGQTAFYLTPNASIAGADTGLAEREYRLYVQPSTVGTLKWCPMAGNLLSYWIEALSPCTMRSKQLHALVDQNGMAWGAFDPHQVFPSTNTDPTWAQ
jgi:hypothetical protein